MSNSKMTRRALLTSIMALMLCLAMLTGTTFAWFTDQETSAGNKIVAGDLDVQLLLWDGDSSDATDHGTEIADYKDIGENSEPIFGTAALAQNSLNTLWEPGKTQVAYLAIKNKGALDLKYTVVLEVENVASNLYEVMEYAITPDAQSGAAVAWTSGNPVELGEQSVSGDVELKSGAVHYFALAVHMKEDAGNSYQKGAVNFDLTVFATQLASENDAIDNKYDVFAGYPGKAVGALTAGSTAVELQIRDRVDDAKLGSLVVPAGAVADPNLNIEASVEKTEYEGNFTIGAGIESQAFDVTVSNLKDGNTTPVKVQLRITAGLDPAKVALYHYDTEIPCTYNPETGYVTFETATFSPFTVLFDADSKYNPPVADENELPKANVVKSTEYENTDLPWGSYGAWSPTEGLDSQLEAAYTFSCVETLEKAEENPYANWYCDFYVKLSGDLGANEIFLGGNYGSFGWVGFHNGDLTLEANTELGLLKSVTTNPWTYLDVVQNVGKFICGVGDVDDALAGATFTVMLRLTNPENEKEFYNVATITHTFAKGVSSGEELQEAIENGNTNIVLNNDIDLGNGGGIVIP